MALSEQYWYLGKGRLVRAGKTELKVILPYGLLSSLTIPPYVYIHTHHTYVPYRVEASRIAKQTVFLSLEHLDLLDIKKQTPSYDLFIAWAWLRKQLKSTFSLTQLFFCVGFTVLSDSKAVLGTVARIEERKMQSLLVVTREGEETMIPLHHTFIQGVAWDKRELTVCWPPS